MAQTHYVIIGNGTAGNRAADVLRVGDKDARITIISSEPTHYLVRHKLAPFLGENKSIEDLSVHSPEWYKERNITLRRNQPVIRVNGQEKYALLAHREIVRYSKLLICSGARHRIPECLSHYAHMLTRFSEGRDAIALKAKLDTVKHVTLLGGDCIALELYAALRKMGKKVAMIMDEYRFWPLELDAAAKDRLAAALESKGMEIIKNDFCAEITPRNGGMTLRTRGGKTVETDAAIITAGMVPNLEFVSDAGLDFQEGLLVNERLETNVKDVWAAGECAQIYYPELKDYRTSTGYRNAETQGEIAAKNMLGGSVEASLLQPGKVIVAGEEFITYGWKGFSLDETN